MKLFLIVFLIVIIANVLLVLFAKKYLDRDLLRRAPVRLGFFLLAMLSSGSLIFSALYIKYPVSREGALPLDTLSRYEPLQTFVIPQYETKMITQAVPQQVASHSIKDVKLDLNNFEITTDVKTDLGDLGDVFGDPTEEGISGDWNKYGVSMNTDAAFPGGYEEFASFVRDNFHVKPRLNGESREVVVFVGFTIGKDGTLEDLNILRGKNEEIDREILRILKMSPRWTPAMKEGDHIEVVKRLPIRIHVFD